MRRAWTVILSDDPLSYDVPRDQCKEEHQWDCWLRPISSCRVLRSVSSSELDSASARFGKVPRITNIKSKEQRANFDAFLTESIKARNHTDRVVYDHPMLGDAALYTCPDKYREMVPECDRWWAGELMDYVFRIEPGLQKALDDYTSVIGYGQGDVAMHVRRGDAIDYLPEKLVTGGGQLQSQYDWPEYMRLIDLAREELTVAGTSPQLFFIATDDKDAASQVVLSKWAKFSRQDDTAVHRARKGEKRRHLTCAGCKIVDMVEDPNALSTLTLLILPGRYKCPVTSYLILSTHDFKTVSKILLDETGTAVSFNVTRGTPQYKIDVVKRLFPPPPSEQVRPKFAKTVDLKLLTMPALTPRSEDTIINYDTKEYPFAEIIKKVIAPSAQDLSFLHQVQSIDNVAMQLTATEFNPLNGSMSEFHDYFYRRLNADDGWPEFMEVWLKFVKEIVMPIFPNTAELVYQKTPTFRVQLPGSATVFSLHSDGDSTNLHPEGEVNFILPLTSGCGNTASTWVESLPFLGDYHPLSMEYGQLNVFDGNRCRHYNKKNVESPACTRVSFDFRAMTREAYKRTVEEKEIPITSFTTKQKFMVGSYYTTMRSDSNVAAGQEFVLPSRTSEDGVCAAVQDIGESHLDPRALDHVMKQYDLKDPWDVVALFENQVAEYAGSKYAVALDTCTFAIFMSLKYLNATGSVTIPASTYISVPASILHAGLEVKFDADLEWSGTYLLDPYPVVDGAVRFTSGMYEKGTLHCLSFHRRKHLKIGRGVMILTDDPEAARWLRLARYNGRRTNITYQEQDDFEVVGWNSYMTPEAAARGVYLMTKIPEHNEDKSGSDGYSDLSKVSALQPRDSAVGPQQDI
ncbi:hypothetical protein TrVE_jg754 [Triparma verrucosa]|uniref:Uncharacterized protein n=1 Tax=Triparma verrucosa TaxID=1606542 RepID=A0A9W7FBW3_9STRA|nr:hypothetical protein TrVE_jg754 [Triparma verrucosa]